MAVINQDSGILPSTIGEVVKRLAQEDKIVWPAEIVTWYHDVSSNAYKREGFCEETNTVSLELGDEFATLRREPNADWEVSIYVDWIVRWAEIELSSSTHNAKIKWDMTYQLDYEDDFTPDLIKPEYLDQIDLPGTLKWTSRN